MVDISKFKDLYISETEDQLQVLNDSLLILEKIIKQEKTEETAADEKKILNDLMRASHTIKGSSATMSFNKTAYLSHVMEDIFDGARNEVLTIDNKIIDSVFQAVDALEKSINNIKLESKELDSEELANKIKNIAGVNTVGTGKSVRDKAAGEKEQDVATVDPKEKEKKIDEEINEVKESIKKIDYIKVPIKRLDTLMDLVEELVINRMVLRQLSLGNSQLQEAADHLNLLTQSLQYEIMQARLVPVEQVFARFPRMVRDLSRKQNKEIVFDILGGDLELDRSIVDKLGEPLVHLLRNAVDHGIVKKGKIKLEATREREFALIKVENNDQLIDLEKVKKAAISRGIISSKEAEAMEEEEIMNLIFHPRVSTKETVTEISGRGVGLSVVKAFAESSGGRVIVNNLNPGVQFVLELPLTLAIINSLLISVSQNMYAIPFSNIERSVEVKNKDIKKMADNEVAIVDGIKIPLLRLDKIFNLKVNDIIDEDIDRSSTTAVIIKKDNELVGLVVDKLVNEQEITVKPLSPVLRRVRGFSGSTILGDGKTILIIDVANLIKEAGALIV